jgi:hypothetical protein
MRHTKRLSGMRNVLSMVDLRSSGTYTARMAIMEGQNMPIMTSNTQKASIWVRCSLL